MSQEPLEILTNEEFGTLTLNGGSGALVDRVFDCRTCNQDEKLDELWCELRRALWHRMEIRSLSFRRELGFKTATQVILPILPAVRPASLWPGLT